MKNIEKQRCESSDWHYYLVCASPYYYALESGLLAEIYHAYRVLIYDTNNRKFISINSNSMLTWEVDTMYASIDQYGTLMMKSTAFNGPLNLKYNGNVIDTISIICAQDDSRIVNYDIAKDSDLYVDGFAPNNSLNVLDYKSEYIESKKYYKVTMTVQNRTPVVYGIQSYDANGNIYAFEFIDSFWDEFSLTNVVYETFTKALPDLLTGKAFTGEGEFKKEITTIEINVPLGGHLSFVAANDSDDVFFANMVELIFGVYNSADETKELVSMIKTQLNQPNLMKVVDRAKAVSILKVALSKDVKASIKKHLAADDLTKAYEEIFAMITNGTISEEVIKQIFTEAIFDAGTGMLESIVESVENLFLLKNPITYNIVNGTDVIGNWLQVTKQIKDLGEIMDIENTVTTIGFRVYYPTYID